VYVVIWFVVLSLLVWLSVEVDAEDSVDAVEAVVVCVLPLELAWVVLDPVLVV
jgi:hypothetical protein